MGDEIAEQLKKLRESLVDSDVIAEEAVEQPVENVSAVVLRKDDGETMDLRRYSEQFDAGMVLQAYKKRGRLVMELTPLFGKVFWYMLLVVSLLASLLLTKTVGVW